MVDRFDFISGELVFFSQLRFTIEKILSQVNFGLTLQQAFQVCLSPTQCVIHMLNPGGFWQETQSEYAAPGLYTLATNQLQKRKKNKKL